MSLRRTDLCNYFMVQAIEQSNNTDKRKESRRSQAELVMQQVGRNEKRNVGKNSVPRRWIPETAVFK